MLRLLDFSPHSWHLSTCILALGMLAPVICSAQVYRCIVHGQVVYQQSPCESTGAQGHEIHIDPTPQSAERIPIPATAPPTYEGATPPSPNEQTAPPAQPPLDPKTERCANWYLQRFAGNFPTVYVRRETLEKGVLTLSIGVPGPRGGFITNTAACEFRGEVLNEGWTEEHAKRLGWGNR
jgi:hypothetical protein